MAPSRLLAPPPLFTASADFPFGCNSNLSLVHWGGDERYEKLGILNGLNLLCQVYTIKHNSLEGSD